MLTAFTLREGRLEQTKIESASDITPEMVWIDMLSPSKEERLLIENFYYFELPEKTEIKDIEASARFYEDEDGIHIHSFFLHDFEETSANITVAFSIFGGKLFTLREEDLASFRLYRMRARRAAITEEERVFDIMDILIGLHETAVEHVADVLEGVYSSLEKVSYYVLTKHSKHHDENNTDTKNMIQDSMESVLLQIAEQEDLNGKARLSLMDTRRSLSFLLRGRLLKPDQTADVKEILQDLESLTNHTSFLFDKVTFLLDAAVGNISLEQNKIIKIFSIAAVVFLPPTLVASIYGMNFKFMPELNSVFGYPWALGLMIISGIAPYWFFKHKGWL